MADGNHGVRSPLVLVRSEFLPGSRLSVRLPEGTWRVRLSFSRMNDGPVPRPFVVRAENRRLVTDAIDLSRFPSAGREILVNIRTPALPPPPENAPGGCRVLLGERELESFTWDEFLTLTITDSSGPADPSSLPDRVELEEEPDAPVLFLAGDSTVTDQPSYPCASWGQMLPRFLNPTVAVANHAESGETLKSFIAGLRLAKILHSMKKGDYLFIQFGHNDQKAEWPQTYASAGSTYPAYLRVFIEEARVRGGLPVLVTSPQRRRFDGRGKIVNTHGDYPDAVRKVAAEENLPLVDLEKISRILYEALGPEGSETAFAPGDGTHHSEYGAYELARAIAGEIGRKIPGLSPAVREEAFSFDPASPDPEASVTEIQRFGFGEEPADRPAGN